MDFNSAQIFSMALGIQSPWIIKEIQFEVVSGRKELHIHIDFKVGSQFPDETGKLCKVHDTKHKTWRHLNFFEHRCYLHCRVPRLETSTGKIQQINLPWAREGSGFTLLFEAYVMALIESETPHNKIGALLNENPHRIWTIFNYWIKHARDAFVPGNIEKMGIDETSTRKGHKYITVAVDLDEKRVFHVVEGKGKDTIKSIKKELRNKGSAIAAMKHISIDLSPSYISGIQEYFPKAAIHFDKYHIVQLLNKAMDEVRCTERKEHAVLSGHKYLFLKNRDKLPKHMAYKLEELITLLPNIGKAYRLKILFYDLWNMKTSEEAKGFIDYWCREAERSKIGPFITYAKMLRSHISGIINFTEAKVSNGLLEGINGKIQLAKRRARGFRNIENLINMVYFLCGKLTFNYPSYPHGST